MPNDEFARLMERAADALEIMGVEWKPSAYRRAANSIRSLKKDMGDIYSSGGKKALMEIPGVGKSIAMHITEYLETGKVKKWEKWFSMVPGGSTELMALKDLGPKKVKALQEALGISDIRSLEAAIKSGKLQALRGFGRKTGENLLKSIEVYKKGQQRMNISVALPLAQEIIAYLKGNAPVSRVDYAGSLRRMRETIGDIDILAVSPSPSKAMGVFVRFPRVSRILAEGRAKSSILLKGGVQVDFRVFSPGSYGAALLYFTGNKEHNILLRNIAIKKGLKLSEYGLFSRKTGRNLASRTEREVYKRLGLPLIPPEMRTAQGEIEAAGKGALPSPVSLPDIRGDLHVHTKYSDGAASIEGMVEAAVSLGYEYIAITDHSVSEKIAHGMDSSRIMKQWKEIDSVSKKYRGKIRVLRGAEVDILPSGELDYPPRILKKLHICVGAVHSSFRMERKKMTSRLCSALRNEYLDILAHPTCRQFGRRDAISCDFDSVFRAAADSGKALEVNSQPLRLDLPSSHIRSARRHGAKFCINTDSHSPSQLENMLYGVGQARRGWLSKKDVVNALPLSSLRRIFRRIPK